ncbi:hypothetical protein MATL_G00144520 [Megalops atlanticus]|uniref:Zinc finger protein SNAI2 n=1 Tax=Megalops atlanticus TaxID=7932 RepID=A0A9D3PWI0_MEGAT|nr:hypothetical protein MATL_G00144520 [Megalops atlanticus]
MPRSFLVKKHLSHKKPNYGQLDSKKGEDIPSPHSPEDFVLAPVPCSEIPCSPPALGGWLSAPLITTIPSVELNSVPTPLMAIRPQNSDFPAERPVQELSPSLLVAHTPLRDALPPPDPMELLEPQVFQLPKDPRLSGDRSGLPAPLLGLAPGALDRFECFDCCRAYFTVSGLAKHKQLHCEWQCHKCFSCKYCDKEYVSLGALKMHIRTHTLPCVCKLCGKAFSRPWLLQGHIRTHTGEKPFSCPHCSRAFADRSNLRAHLQTHSEIKKYQCKSCSKTFSRISLLSKHEEAGCCPLS